VLVSLAERQAIHRGTYTSAKDLNAKIRAFIDGWNDRCHPFVWTKTADQILKKANRQQTSETSPGRHVYCAASRAGNIPLEAGVSTNTVIPQACCGTG